MRIDCALHENSSSRGGEKWSDLGYISNIRTRFLMESSVTGMGKRKKFGVGVGFGIF